MIFYSLGEELIGVTQIEIWGMLEEKAVVKSSLSVAKVGCFGKSLVVSKGRIKFGKSCFGKSLCSSTSNAYIWSKSVNVEEYAM